MADPMNVSAIIVTRGDVDLSPILRSLPREWEVLVWDNGVGELRVRVLETMLAKKVTGFTMPDLSVYGRYAAIEYASHEMVYVQDDDVIVSDPQAIVDSWAEEYERRNQNGETPIGGHVVCNMPQEFRHDFYRHHALVGFGAAFHRDVPRRAFEKIGFDGRMSPFIDDGDWYDLSIRRGGQVASFPNAEFIRRTCDIPVTALSPRVLVDVPKENLPYANDDNRMWRQPTHQAERARMLDFVIRMKEAG